MKDPGVACRVEDAALHGWPATIQRAAPGGWLLRATPGLDRGRSNSALPPCRALDVEEIGPAIARVYEFAREHSIRPMIQVSPLELHHELACELDRRGWTARWPALVLTGPATVGSDSAPITTTDHADPAWLRAWARCEPGRDLDGHARTVFELLRGRACFARIGYEAVGIGVPHERLLGMFCVAVEPGRRRAGLGTAVVKGLLKAATPGAELAYLQVEKRNDAACAMYRRLGFRELYRYCHRLSRD